MLIINPKPEEIHLGFSVAALIEEVGRASDILKWSLNICRKLNKK